MIKNDNNKIHILRLCGNLEAMEITKLRDAIKQVKNRLPQNITKKLCFTNKNFSMFILINFFWLPTLDSIFSAPIRPI